MRAIAYIRVSTDEQALGPEAQREAVARWAQSTSAEVARVYEDIGMSGSLPPQERPGLAGALGSLREVGAEVLVVAKRDRLARSTSAAGMVEQIVRKAGARIVSAAGEGTSEDENDPSAALMRGIVDLFAEYERSVIRARVKSALGVKKSRGQRVSRHIPYGLALAADGALVPDVAELALLERISAMRKSGLSVRAIADILNGEGVPCRGGRWHKTTIHNLTTKADGE